MKKYMIIDSMMILISSVDLLLDILDKALELDSSIASDIEEVLEERVNFLLGEGFQKKLEFVFLYCVVMVQIDKIESLL
jgi:hypothetical protein